MLTLATLPLIVRILLPALTTTILWCIYNRFLHPLAKIPGPASARWGIPFWQFWHAYKCDYVWALKAQHDKYGGKVRIGPNHVSFSSPTAANIIYAHGANFNKTPFYSSIQVYPKHPSLFSDIDPHSHAARRRAISAAYTMTSLVSLEEYVEPVIDLLTEKWEAALQKSIGTGNTAQLDVSRWMHFFATDSVGEIAFGQSFGFVDQGADPKNFLAGVTNLSLWGCAAGCIPSLSLPIRRALKWLSGQPGAEVVGRSAESFVDARFQAVAQMQDGGEFARQDMLAKFMKSKNPKTGKVYNQHEVLTTAISVIGAGSDTTSIALASFFGFLIRNPTVYKKLVEEIDNAFDDGTLTFPIKYSQGVQLPLFQACVKETLRLHPPASMSLPRFVPPEGAIIDGTALPAGTVVSCSPYVLHRTKEAYGPDAEVWRPERWLDLSDDDRRAMERCNMSFGGGSRQCIGKNISLMEITKLLPTLLKHFHFSYDPNRERALPVRDTNGATLDRSIPFRASSYWFLEIKDMVLDVSVRDQ